MWARLAAAEPRLGEAAWVEAADASAARAALDELLASGRRRVVVVGGDGSLHLAANAILRSGLGAEVTLGLAPLGSGCDLACGLGLPRAPRRALRLALHGAGRSLDALRLCTGSEVRYGVNVASFGISAEVAGAVDRLRRRGPFSYLAAAVGALRGYRAVPVKVYLDGALWHQGPLLLLAVANGGCFGGGMRIAPHALADDGLAEVVLVRRVSVWKVLPRLPYLYLGAHLGLSFVYTRPARRVRIVPAAEPVGYELDGERLEAGEVELEVLSGALRVARGRD